MDVGTDIESSPVLVVPKPHDFLWFPGGDVVLSTDSYLFKVHKDVLSLQSSVFRDMFGLPTQAIDTLQINDDIGAGLVPEMYEGLPLVALAGDKGEDVAHLLRTAYERQYYDRDDDQTPLEVIVSLLVLSTKYDFKYIRKEVIRQISYNYPMMTLDEYQAVDFDQSKRFGAERAACHFRLLEALFVSDVDALLPILYYACSDYAISIILFEAENLNAACLHTLIAGRDQLQRTIDSMIAKLPDIIRDEGFTCSSGSDCPNSAHVTRLEEFLGSSDLGDCEGQHLVETCVEGACSDCKEILMDKINASRDEIWEKVPSYFGFQDWDVLREKLKELCSK